MKRPASWNTTAIAWRKRRQRDVGDILAVDAHAAGVGLPHALQQRQRRRLAGARGADQRHRLARPRRDIDVGHTLRAGAIAERHLVEDDIAFDVRQQLGIGLLDDEALGVDELEIGPQRRRLLIDAHEEARELIELADEQIGKTDKRDDRADRDLVALRQHGADREHQHHGDGRGRARQHGEQSPPGQHRVLRVEQLAHDVAHGLHLGAEPGVALHDRDVAEHVADAAIDAAVIAARPPTARRWSCSRRGC